MRTSMALVLCLAVAAWAVPASAGPEAPDKAVKPGDAKTAPKEPKKFKPADDPKKDPHKGDGKFHAPKDAGHAAAPEKRQFPETIYMGSIGLYIPLAYPDKSTGGGDSVVSRYDAYLDLLTFIYRWRQDSGIRLSLANAGGLFYAKEQCTGACLQNLVFNGFQIGYERFFGKSETFIPSAYLTVGPAIVVENFSLPKFNDSSTWDYRWGYTGELGGIARMRMKKSEWAPFFQAKVNYFGYSGAAGTTLIGFGIGLGLEHTF